MGWDERMIEVIDSDLGQSGSDSEERHGFQHLVSEVSLGRAGIIAGIEVSRLSRNSTDWSRLLQIAALSDSLIMDEDGVYNVNDFNDRLLLGLKGTLFEAELHYLKARMRGGLLNKAKRGELRRPIPVGYVYDENGQIRKDPDSQVQESIMLLFNTFVRAGSAGNLVREYERQGFLFPRRQHGGVKYSEPMLWERMTKALALRVLNNPMYAGIYAYGKTQVQYSVGGRKAVIVPKEQYHAWLPNSHPAYISETQFDENNRQLDKNSRPKRVAEHGGAVREGSALLQGIALCGKCGRKMSIRYTSARSRTQPFYICNESYKSYGEAVCQNVRGRNIDPVIETLLLETINPLTTDAAISIQREMTERKTEILRLYSQQLERARYDMDLAKRRYLHVDPENRLVAAELEYDWNQRVIAFESAKAAFEQKSDMEIRAVDDGMKLSLAQLVSDFPKIWNDPCTSYREKKRIARLVLEDVTITSETSKIVLGIRFKSGSTKVLEVPNIKRDLHLVNMEEEAASVIKMFLCPEQMITYNEIAVILNERGFRSGPKGKLFDKVSVSSLIQRYGLPKRTDIVMNNKEGWLTAKEKMAELGIGKSKLYRMRISGELVFSRCSHHGAAYLYKPGVISDMQDE